MNKAAPAKAADSPRFVIPPPVAAPPVEFDRQTDTPLSSSNDFPARSRAYRVVIYLQIGFCCLLLGLIVGQAGLLDLADSSKPAASLRSMNDLPETRAVSVEVFDDRPEPLITVPSVPTQSDSDSSQTASQSDLINGQGMLASATAASGVDDAVLAGESVVVDGLHAGVEGLEKTVVKRTRQVAAYLGEQWLLAEQNIKPEVDPLVLLPASEHLSVEQLPESIGGTCRDGTCEEADNCLGTTIHWSAEPKDAYQLAEQQDKLVFLIHVSGNFKIPGFT
ncbi:MAG: hypothetical protein ACPGLY_17050 [Rubripirellula sp.]